MNRREFLETVAAAAVPALAGPDPAHEWGTPVFDLHFHLRPERWALAHAAGRTASIDSLLNDTEAAGC